MTTTNETIPVTAQGQPVLPRGRLKVFLDAAPGVGKTYRMLDEAHRRVARGADVVAGFVECHRRRHTEVKLHGLERLPPADCTYRGGRYPELGREALLSRRPQVVLIDELARSNVPGGGRHAKRWQDVEKILAAGIDVVTTLNIQHLESLSDVVEKKDMHSDHPSDPRETLLRSGATVGFLEEARYQALRTDKDDPSWDAKWLHHGCGGAANFIPVVGDAAQRGVDALAYQWQLDEQARINAETTRQNGETFTARERELQALADEWAKVDPGGGSNRHVLTSDINGAAFEGNQKAQGLAGAQ
ncbi:histidine kinase [Streptomyces erythrochromogenes]|uniref:histidine kinase n=1 Tax=Streptomyces erythrochromogenes TaxID=285574 RepID=UPI0037F89859